MDRINSQIPMPKSQVPGIARVMVSWIWNRGAAMVESLLGRDDADPSAVLTVVFEADFAVHLGEQRVVLPEAHVQSRLEATSLLTDQDRSAGDEIAVVTFHAEPLRVAVAAVT